MTAMSASLAASVEAKRATSLDYLKRLEERTVKRSLDIVGDVIDEVALEGLDGITLQGLWERLKRRPGFTIAISDESTKNYIWRCVKISIGIKIYELPTTRPDLNVYERNDYKDDRGNVVEPLSLTDDIYTYCPIDDKKNHIRGSCSTYWKRRNITSAARKLNYAEINEKYGNKLVIVASQHQREKTILPPDIESDIEMTIIQYCIIERVARARYPGEGTRGKVSLSVMKIDPKSLFYQRKLLLKKKIITKQSFSMKFGESRITSLISILHIPRFYTPVETVMNKNIKNIFAYLKQMPFSREESARMKNMFSKHIIRTILTPEYSDLFFQTDASYAELHPEVMEKETNPVKLESHRRKKVKVIVLKDPNVSISNFFRMRAEEKEEAELECPPEKAHFAAENLSSQVTLIYKTHRHVINSGARGATLREIAEAENISNLDARTACRFMVRLKLASTILEDLKKTKVHRYVWFKYKSENVIYKQLGSQAEKDTVPMILGPSVTQPQTEELTYWAMVEGSSQPQLMSLTTNLPAKPQVPVAGTSRSAMNPKLAAYTKEIRSATGEKLVILDCGKIHDMIHDAVPDYDVHEIEYLKKKAEQKAARLRKKNDSTEFSNHNLHFSKGEANDFVRIEGKEDISFSYETSGGWLVVLEPADVKSTLGKNNTTFNSMKNVERGNFVLEMIYKQTLVLGFQQILRGVRKHEATYKGREEADRRSLYRILKQLQVDKRIQMWRISVSSGAHRRVCSAFTPGNITENNPLLVKAVDSLIQSVIRRAKLTRDQKRQRQKKFSILRKTIASSVNTRTTREKAKPGPKKKRPLFQAKQRSQRSRSTYITADDKHVKERPRVYDEVDKQALARMKGLRGDWTSDEDRHALCLFISSVLFIPRYNLEKVFIFNAPQIRDIMHSKLEESRCKTAVSVRRRLHFLMKNKTFYARYRYYLNTALDDQELRSEILSQYNTKYGSGKIFYEIPTDALLKVFEYLMNLFSNSSSEFKLVDDTSTNTTNTQTKTTRDYESGENANVDDKSMDDDDHDDDDQEYYISKEFYDESKGKVDRQLDSNEQINHMGISVVRLRARKPVIVDGKDDPLDKMSINIWTARTSLLSLILSGETMSDVTSFLDCVSDNVLDYVVQNLRILAITTITKPENRFTISAGMKRKLQTHLPTSMYRQCLNALNQLRRGKKFECVPEISGPALFLLPDFTTKHAMSFGIELPDAIITVNEEWQDLFSALASKELEEAAKKAQIIPPIVEDNNINMEEPELDQLNNDNIQNRKRKVNSELFSQTVKRERIDNTEDDNHVVNEQSSRLDLLMFEEFDGLSEIPINVKTEPHDLYNDNENLSPSQSTSVVCDPSHEKLKFQNLPKTTTTPTNDTVEDILNVNHIFKRKCSKVRDDEQNSNNTNSLKSLVLRSDSITSEDLNTNMNVDNEDNNTIEISRPPSQYRPRRGDVHTKTGCGVCPNTDEMDVPDGDEDGDGEGDSVYLDDDESPDYAVSDDQGSEPDSEDDVHLEVEVKNKKKTAKVVESLRNALLKLPQHPKKGIRKASQRETEDNEMFDEIGDNDNEEEDDGESLSGNKGRISNKTLRTLRAKINATQAESRMIEKDFFSVNLPKLSVIFSSGSKINDILYGGSRPMSDALYLQNLLVKTVPINCINSATEPGTDAGMARYAKLYETIDICEEVGISIPYLLSKFERSYVSSGLQCLLNSNYVYMVGVQYRRFVASCHSQKWTMPVPTSKGLIFSERVIMRPWITSFGCINWPMVIQVFSTLIGYLNMNPSIRVKNLCKLILPMLSCVEAMILIEALAHMDFIKLYTLDLSHEITLFSKPSYVKKIVDIDEFVDMEFLFVELKPYATAKFADLQEAINPVTLRGGKTCPDVLGD